MIPRLHYLAAATGLAATAAVALASQPAAHTGSKQAPAVSSRALTFHRDIAPIVYQNCSWCHHAGEVAPFSLMGYEDVKKRAQQIAAVTEGRYMPPWKAESNGEFCDERKLSDAQIAAIKRWVEQGASEGSPAEGPKPPHFDEGWQLGQPDVVLKPTRAYTLGAEGDDVYRNFVIPTDLGADRYVSAVEVRPGNRKVVHHVLIYLDATGAARKLEAADKTGEPGYTSFGGVGFVPTGSLGGWAPGNLPLSVPDDVGMRLPKGSDLVLQVHYHRDGKPETDRTSIGIHFCKKPVDKTLRYGLVVNPFINIPPGDASYHASASLPVPKAVTVLGIVPHMHLLGREMTVNAHLPDGATERLIKVADWDFNWQMSYRYKQPLKLPAGSSITLDARYDNSTGNARNPSNPPKRVHWGEQTTDEMCIAFIAYTVDAEHLTKGVRQVGISWFDR